MENQPKELTLNIRIILFLIGLVLVFISALFLSTIIDAIGIQNKNSKYLIYLGGFCILLWFFIKSLIKIPIGFIGIPLILNSVYKGFVFPAGHTWLPFFRYIAIDQKRQFVNLDFDGVLTEDYIRHSIKTNVEYNIVDPFKYLENNTSDIFNKIQSGIAEVIRTYSSNKNIDTDVLLKDTGLLKNVIADGLSYYGNNYGIAIAEVQIKSISPSNEFVSQKEDLLLLKNRQLLNIELRFLSEQKRIEVLALIASKYNISFDKIAKFTLLDNGKITLNEVVKTFNINLSDEIINMITNIIK